LHSDTQFTVQQGVVIVKRPKTPVLTLPWKIGFFVSLMLVVVSAGVAYFFVRKSEFAGATPELTSWSSLVESIRPPDGAVIEFWPLLAIVGVSSLLAYFLTTRAVRQYKAYLDSGYDYKNLLASIREIDDLEDRSRIKQLRNHPELRDFLIGIREMTAARTKELDKREDLLDRLAQESGDDVSGDLRGRLSLECDRLVDAIQVARRAGFPDSVELAIPQLQGIRQALRAAFVTGDQSSRSREFSGNADQFEEIARELEADIEAAREIESNLGEAASTGALPSTDTATIRGEIEGLIMTLTDVQGISSELEGMDEEAKSVAINTALKAGSSEGTQADLIQLAEDIKGVAAKFGKLSKSSLTLTEDVTGHVNAIQAELNRFLDSINATSQTSGVIEAAMGKASRWVEHLVVLLEKVKRAGEALPAHAQPEEELVPDDPGQPEGVLNLEEPGGGPKIGETTQPAGPERWEADPGQFDVNDYGFDTIERVRPLFSEDRGEAPKSADIKRDSEQVIAEPTSKDGMFAELSDSAPDAFEQDGIIDHDAFPNPEAESAETQPAEQPGGSFELEGSLVDLPPVGQQTDAPAADPDVNDDVVDLYALGAVDYNPAVHN
jgi:hypothetical protein